MDVALRLGLGTDVLEQLFRRMVFNIMARNQDDHTKNIAFLMNKRGEWRLAPAYDVIYCYNPNGAWTRRHQMSVNGKHDHFEQTDFESVAKRFGILRGNQATDILEQTAAVLARWPQFAADAGVPERVAQQISGHHRRL
jgi:serine/threonine-protein kinase HipA